MTVRDFMNYLIYIEHSAENLQFFLWYKDYVKRFGNADTTDLHLSPEWTQAMEDEVVTRLRKDNAEKMRPEPAAAAELFKGTDLYRTLIVCGVYAAQNLTGNLIANQAVYFFERK